MRPFFYANVLRTKSSFRRDIGRVVPSVVGTSVAPLESKVGMFSLLTKYDLCILTN